MDKKETRFISNPVRLFFLKHLEFKIFKKFLKKNNIDLSNKIILDAGCGPGYSSELIINELRPQELFAFDIMPEEVEIAKRRRLPMNIFVGDITDTKLPSESFDAVFAFCVMHHVPDWQKSIKEISRVLKPGGVFLFDEPDKSTLDWAERYLKIYHPKESRFEWPEFTKSLREAGFLVVENRKIYFGFINSFLCVKSLSKPNKGDA